MGKAAAPKAVVSTTSERLLSQKRSHVIIYVLIQLGLKDKDNMQVEGRGKAVCMRVYSK